MGLEQGDLTVLIQRVGAQIETRAVGVRGHDADALLDGTRADDSSDEVLAAVIDIDLVAGTVGLLGVERFEALAVQQHQRFIDALALGLGGPDEFHIAAGQLARGGQLSLAHDLVGAFALQQNFVRQQLRCGFLFFRHKSLQMIFYLQLLQQPGQLPFEAWDVGIVINNIVGAGGQRILRKLGGQPVGRPLGCQPVAGR